MLRDECNEVVPTWAGDTAAAGRSAKHVERGKRGEGGKHERFREIDHELRTIAKQKTALEVDEARWLREAERLRVWRKLGFSTALEYLEDVFGYAPRTAKDRLRVAKELGELPGLEAELRSGALPYSAARELTRVMTRATEAQWLARARGRSVGDIQALVAGHKRGDTPDDPKDPALMTLGYLFNLDTRRQALFEQVRAACALERGEHVEDEDVFETMCVFFLDSATAPQDKPTRPAHQIVIHKNEPCGCGAQEARGRHIPLRRQDLEAAECDAELTCATDLADAQANGTRQPRPTPTIPAKTRKLVWRRDEGRCRFPGCRATRNLRFHHIRYRSHGGDHDPSNLLLLCDGHHKLLHDDIVTITGSAPDQLVFTRDGKQLPDPRAPGEQHAAEQLREVPKPKVRTRFDDVVKLEQAKQALKQLGFKASAAKRALEEACVHVGTDADIPTLVEKVLAMNREASLDESDADVQTLAKRALVKSGYPAAVAVAAVSAARAHVSTDASLETLIMEAFRRCVGRG